MSLLFNILSCFVIAFLPRSKHLLISQGSHHPHWFWSPRKWNLTLFPLFLHLFAMKWQDWMAPSSRSSLVPLHFLPKMVSSAYLRLLTPLTYLKLGLNFSPMGTQYWRWEIIKLKHQYDLNRGVYVIVMPIEGSYLLPKALFSCLHVRSWVHSRG